MTTPAAAPRAEGSKPLRESKRQRAAQAFLESLDDLIGPREQTT